MLVDEAEIYIKGGNGGDGCTSFRREKYVPRGGPDGGDGGNGGNVVVVATPGVDTLLDFKGKHHWIARNGQPGMGKKMFGKNADDLVLRLPIGTLMYDRDTGVLIKDLDEMEECICIAEGGKGGRGNAKFATATHQAPMQSEAGTDGQERWLKLSLKLFADVGLVGLPNAGKSTILSRLSKARPKIADYPFTTMQPHPGIVELSGNRRYVMADIPGLIEGAHEGAGLGDEFLRHIERTRVLLHVVDVGSDLTPGTPEQSYWTIRGELEKYSQKLADKEEIIVANKVDLTDGRQAAETFAKAIGKDVLPISAVAGIGLPKMTEMLWKLVEASKDPEEKAKEEPQDELPMRTPPHLRES